MPFTEDSGTISFLFQYLCDRHLLWMDTVVRICLGTVTAVWLYNNFVGWLNILNCTLPPVGMIVVLGYFCHKEEYEKWDVIPRQVNWFAIAGVLIGAAVANLVPWGIASVNGMVIAAVCYLVGELVERKKK